MMSDDSPAEGALSPDAAAKQMPEMEGSTTITSAAGEQLGLQAGPLRMLTAGLIAGGVLVVLLNFYPFFEVDPAAFDVEAISPTESEMQRMLDMRDLTAMKNSVAVGGLIGLVLASGLCLCEAFTRRFHRSLPSLLLSLLAGSLGGLAAGFAAQSFQTAFELSPTMEPLLRTLVVQAIFWSAIAAAVGVGLGLFTRNAKLWIGVVLQGIFAAGLFSVVYVPVVIFFFPLEDTECVVPYSFGNQASWVVLATVLLGWMLGFGRRRR